MYRHETELCTGCAGSISWCPSFQCPAIAFEARLPGTRYPKALTLTLTLTLTLALPSCRNERGLGLHCRSEVAEKCSDTISIYVASSSLRQPGEDLGQKTTMKTGETNTKKDQEEGLTPKLKTRTNTKDQEQMTKNKVKVNDKHQNTKRLKTMTRQCVISSQRAKDVKNKGHPLSCNPNPYPNPGPDPNLVYL